MHIKNITVKVCTASYTCRYVKEDTHKILNKHKAIGLHVYIQCSEIT